MIYVIILLILLLLIINYNKAQLALCVLILIALIDFITLCGNDFRQKRAQRYEDVVTAQAVQLLSNKHISKDSHAYSALHILKNRTVRVSPATAETVILLGKCEVDTNKYNKKNNCKKLRTKADKLDWSIPQPTKSKAYLIDNKSLMTILLLVLLLLLTTELTKLVAKYTTENDERGHPTNRSATCCILHMCLVILNTCLIITIVFAVIIEILIALG